MNAIIIDASVAIKWTIIEPYATEASLARQKLAYDAQYVALAQQLECDFWTADKEFYDEAHAEFPQVRWIGIYQTTAL